MINVSKEEYADIVVNASDKYEKEKVINWLDEALEKKNAGGQCTRCGRPIWAAGSGITGRYMCFSCHTGERAETADDYEIIK